MMRLPWFDFRQPRSVDEAARILAGEGGGAMLIAGGTDLLPNMKRRQQVPRTLVSLRGVDELRGFSNGSGVRIGAGQTLSQLAAQPKLRQCHAALAQAAAQVATSHLRNMGTIGGNLCLDTRCNYYNQSHEWRKAIDYCLKKDGETCWVATASKRCVAASSTDCAPALLVLGASVNLASAAGAREVPLAEFYRNDGIDYMARRPDEILTEVGLPDLPGWRSVYWKLRRRGAFDFPVLGVAAAARVAADGTVEQARVALGAVASRPFLVDKAGTFLVGKRLTDEVIAEASAIIASRAKPLDNTDLDLYWRKGVAGAYATYALRDLRGDDMRETRRATARQLVP